MKKFLLLLAMVIIAFNLVACGEESKVEIKEKPVEPVVDTVIDDGGIDIIDTGINNEVDNGTGSKEDDFVPETGAGSLKEAIEMFKKVDLGISKDKVIEILGEPQEVKDDRIEYVKEIKSSKYFTSKIRQLYVYLNSDNIVIGKYIPIGKSDETLYNMSIIEELGSDLESAKDAAENLHEGMSFNDTLNVLGNKYYEKEATNEYLERHNYWWYDLNGDYINLNFIDGKISSIAYSVDGALVTKR